MGTLGAPSTWPLPTSHLSMPFSPPPYLHYVAGIFGVAHAVTGLAALLFNTDVSFGILLNSGDFKPYKRGRKMLEDKAPDIATAPNVRGWGTRQFVVSLAFWYALYSGERA